MKQRSHYSKLLTTWAYRTALCSPLEIRSGSAYQDHAFGAYGRQVLRN